jgi:hypothetical protein
MMPRKLIDQKLEKIQDCTKDLELEVNAPAYKVIILQGVNNCLLFINPRTLYIARLVDLREELALEGYSVLF